MPMHDWTCVEAGVFHDFHHAWIEEIKRALNKGVLPEDYYAMAEQRAGGLGPDVLTLQYRDEEANDQPGPTSDSNGGGGVSLAPPPVQLTAETDSDFYHRKQNRVVIRHVTGDPVIAVIEVVSPGNKSGHRSMSSFVQKALEFFEHDVHMLVLDVHPPGQHDPTGVHGAIWHELTDEMYSLPADRPFTVAAYESDLAIRAYVEHVGIGDALPDMPLFLRPRAHVIVPLEATYQAAFDAFPRRWQSAVE